MEWTVVTVLIAVAGLFGAVGAPVIRLNSKMCIRDRGNTLDSLHFVLTQRFFNRAEVRWREGETRWTRFTLRLPDVFEMCIRDRYMNWPEAAMAFL